MKRLLAIVLVLVMLMTLLPAVTLTASASWPPEEPVISGCPKTDDGYHNLGVYQSREPSCTQTGLIRWFCYECDYIEDVGYPALGHDYVDGWCTRCGQADPDAIPEGCTLHENFTVLDGTDGATQGESCANAVDANDDSQWRVVTYGNFDGAYIEFDAGTAFVPVRYLLYTGSNTQMYPARRPKSWVLKGKTFPEDDWTVIDTVTNDDTLPSSPKKSAGFDVSADGGIYRYFRLEISAVRWGGDFGEGSGYQSMELSEIRFYGTEPVRTYTWVEATQPTCTEAGRVACYACNDGGYYATQDTSNRLIGAALYPYPALGHDFNAQGVCTRCGAQDTGAQTGTSIQFVNAANGISVTSSYVTVDADTTDWTSRFYVVSSDVTISDRITVSGHAKLILGEDVTLTATKGITVPEGSQLTVYRKYGGTLGKLVATAESGNAAIGGLDGQNSGTVAIYGGEITATGGYYAAGIGGGQGGSGSVQIGGTEANVVVTAKGSYDAAGIGGGMNADGGSITIGGGRVTAEGKNGGAGIGGGLNGSGGTISISAGRVNAKGASFGSSGSAGIGGGSGGSGGTITISGGQVVATSYYGTASIGGGLNGAGGTITISGGTVESAYSIGAKGSDNVSGDVTITGGYVTIRYGESSADAGVGCPNGNTTIALTGNSRLIAGKLFGTVTLGTVMVSYPAGLLVTQENCATIGSFVPHTHSFEHHAAKTPTCVEPGNLEWWGCSCGLYYTDEQCTQPTTPEAVNLPATGVHTVEFIPAVAMTANSLGNSAYYRCTVCGKCFTDENYQNEINEQDTILRPEVSYLDENGTLQVLTRYVAVTADCIDWSDDIVIGGQSSDGWYVVLGTVTLNQRATLDGDIKLVLPDGSQLNAAGLQVLDSLSIYAQSTGDNMGYLNSVCTESAGIGYGSSYSTGVSPDITINIYGGRIRSESKAEGSPGIGGNRCTMTINGGNVTGLNYAVRDENYVGISRGVGIGSVCFTQYGYFHLTINGGTVTAQGGTPSDEYSTGCGIGGWNDEDNFDASVTIHGGTVNATSGSGGAAIGGYEENSGTIVIDGGDVTAHGGMYGSGIGGGNNGGCTSLTISGNADVHAYGGQYGAGIGGGSAHNGGNILIEGGTVTAVGGDHGAGIGGGGGIAYAGSGGHITISGGTVTATGGTRAAGIGSGGSNEGYANSTYITITGGSITAEGGDSEYAASFTNDYRCYGGAGIGGGAKCSGGTITITGGTVNATYGTCAAAIGGGYMGSFGTIAISGGNVMAHGAIGCGLDLDDPSPVTLAWTELTDTIHASSYRNVDLTFLRGFVLEGTTTPATADNINNKTLVPAALVRFDAGEGSGSMDQIPVAFGGTLNLPDCGFDEPEGKEFDAWQLGGVRYTVGSTVTVNEDITFTALWKLRYYSVDCTVSGGTLGADRATARMGDTVTLTAAPSVGHVFTADTWTVSYTDRDNVVHELTLTPVEGTEDRFTFTMPAGPVTVHATFTALDTHTYTFTPGIGIGTGIEEPVFTTMEFTVPECSFTAPAGMHFLGWRSNDTLYLPGEVLTVTVDATFTAQWGYQVRFQPGEGSGTMEDVFVSVPGGSSVSYTLPACTFTAPQGKVFAGWSYGGSLYQQGETTSVSEDAVFTAKWSQTAAYATTGFTVEFDTTQNKFVITRTGDLSEAKTVTYRTVSESAIADKHFTSTTGSLTFAAGDATPKTVAVTEKTSTQIADGPYRYQQGTTRCYRFEVLDEGGFELASCRRTLTYGTAYRIQSSNAFAEKTYTIFSDQVSVTDGGYDQAYYEVPLSTFFSATAPKNYIKNTGARLSMTLEFDAREKDDGYQYVQIIANNTTDCDTGAKDGNPGTISLSSYMAGFTIDGNVNTTFYHYRFPVLNYGSSCGELTHPWSSLSNSVGSLVQQYFKEPTDGRDSSGRLSMSINLSSLGFRLNASGNLNDTWYVKNAKVTLQAVDTSQPTVVIGETTAPNGSYYTGNTVTVAIPFNEIVNVTGTPTLNTDWGTLSYVAGSGTNVLAFSGRITAPANTLLKINSISGTVRDQKNNNFKSFSVFSINKRVLGTYSYDISYDLNSGSLPANASNPSTYAYTDAAITLVNPIRTGYTFAGWTGTELSGLTRTVTIPAGSTGDRSYTANWVTEECAISYDLGGGALPAGSSNPETYNIESGAITLVNPTRDGWDFAGWTGTGLSEPTLSVTIPAGVTGNRSYTANWELPTVPATFDPGDGSGTAYTVSVVIGSDYVLPDTLPAAFTAPAGMELYSWDVDGASYEPGETVYNVTSAMTVTAVYGPARYSITFSLAGSNEISLWTDSGEISSGDLIVIGETVHIRIGYDGAGQGVKNLTVQNTDTNEAVAFSRDGADALNEFFHFTMPAGAVSVTAETGLYQDIRLDYDDRYGTITTDPGNQALEGTVVTLTATPVAGYGLDTLTVTDGDGNPVNVSNNQFTMPNRDVTVSATFTMTWASLQTSLAGLSSGDTVTITLPYDVTATATDGPLTVPAGASVTLDLNGHTLDRNLTAEVENGYVILANGNLTIQDSSDPSTGCITGGKNIYDGGGVCISGGNSNQPGGTLKLEGGTIYGNSAHSGGGVFIDVNSTFTMSGGSINDNTASDCGGGVSIGSNSTFTMSGGEIDGNIANGNGGGVYLGTNSRFDLSGGTISGNSTANSYGGGVYVNSSTFYMSGGTISGNSAEHGGGGVLVNNGSTYNLTDGEVSDNTAEYGGGVYANSGTFYMSGGTISGNSATYAGGGVNLQTGVFALSGGTITGNTAQTNGGGVLMNNASTTFRVSGGPVVTGNTKGTGGPDNNVFLANGRKIVVNGSLTDAACIGVSTYNTPTAGSPVTFTADLSGNGTTASFVSDNDVYGVFETADGEAALRREYVVTIADGIFDGTVTADPMRAPAGTTVTLTATPDAGYELVSLTVTDANDGPVEVTNGQFTMPASNVEVQAEFDLPGHLITVDYHGSAEVNLAVNNSSVEGEPVRPGQTVVIHLTYDGNGQGVRSLTVTDTDNDEEVEVQYVEGGVVDELYSFTMPDGAVTIRLETAMVYGITLNDSGLVDHVDLSADGSAVYNGDCVTEGKTVRIAVGFDGAGQGVKSLTVWNTTANEAVAVQRIDEGFAYEVYTFTMPAGDVSIDVVGDFLYYIQKVYDGEGTILIEPDEIAFEGTVITLTATPDAGYVLNSLTVTDDYGSPIATQNGVFTMPASNVTVSASFVPADGYYLIGPKGWTAADLSPTDKFTLNPNDASEYMLGTTLSAGDEFKVVKLENGTLGTWYPGEGSNYTVGVNQAGMVTVYFRPNYDGGDGWHYSCIYIAAGRNPFVAHNLTLEGQIGENFIVNLNGMDAQAVANASVTFTWDVTQANGSVTHNTQTVLLRDLEPMTEAGYIGCYKVPVKVAAKEMTDSIHAVLTVGGETYEDDFSVRDYALTILDDANHEIYSEELWNLAKAMLNYGAAAQQQFTYKTDTPANALPSQAIQTLTPLDSDEIDGLTENTIGTLPDGISFVASSLLLRSETTYRLYFTVESGSTLTVTRNGEPLTATKKGSYWYVEITDIAAKEILNNVTLSVNGVDCTFNAGNYIKSVLTDAAADPTLVNTVTALYRYCMAARDYFN